jgi:hypothetical protein
MFEFHDRARSMLTPEQSGKLMIFHKRFESQLLERLGRFREGRWMSAPGPDEPVEPQPEDDG